MNIERANFISKQLTPWASFDILPSSKFKKRIWIPRLIKPRTANFKDLKNYIRSCEMDYIISQIRPTDGWFLNVSTAAWGPPVEITPERFGKVFPNMSKEWSI